MIAPAAIVALVQVVAVQVGGSAEVKDGNAAAARKAALEDALRAAVEQALGGLYDEPTRKASQKTIQKRVLRNARLFVPVYRVLDERTVPGEGGAAPRVELLVEAQVSTRSVLRELQDLVPQAPAQAADVRPAVEVRGEGAELVARTLRGQGLEVAGRDRGAVVAQLDVSVKDAGLVRGTRVRVLRATAKATLTARGESTPVLDLAVDALAWGADPVATNQAAVARALGRLGPALAARIAARYPATPSRGGQIVLEGPWEWADFAAVRAAASAAGRADAQPLAFSPGQVVLTLPPGATAQAVAESITRGVYPPGHLVKVARAAGGEVRLKLERAFEGTEPAPAPEEPKP